MIPETYPGTNLRRASGDYAMLVRMDRGAAGKAGRCECRLSSTTSITGPGADWPVCTLSMPASYRRVWTFEATTPNAKIPATQQETRLSEAMIDYWTSFARTGRPQATNQPNWPAYGALHSYMAFTDAPHPSDHLLPGMYELNEKVVSGRRARGDTAWNWNAGIASPKLPAQNTPAR
jgi:hypothetical protein